MANPNTAAKGEKGDVGLCGRIAEGKASIGKSTAATTETLCVKGVNIFTKRVKEYKYILILSFDITHGSQPQSFPEARIRKETEIGLDTRD